VPPGHLTSCMSQSDGASQPLAIGENPDLTLGIVLSATEREVIASRADPVSDRERPGLTSRSGTPRARPYPPSGPLANMYQSDIIFMTGRVADTAGDRRHPDARTQRQHRCERSARAVANSPPTRHTAPDQPMGVLPPPRLWGQN
jgi:hypothetical protein